MKNQFDGKRLLRGCLLALALVLVAQVPSAFAAEAPTAWAGFGETLSGRLVEATGTDIVMRNDKLAVAIAATYEDSQLPSATLGKPVDMAAAGVTDGIDWINLPYLSLEQPVWKGSGLLTTVQNKSVCVTKEGPDEAVVEAEGVYTEVEGVTVKTTYTIRPSEEWVLAVSTITNQSGGDLTVWVGDTLDNDDGDQYTLVPGAAVLGDGSTRQVFTPTEPWGGQYGDAPQVFAMVYVIDPADFYMMGSNVTVMSQKKVTIPAKGQYSLKRYLVVAPADGSKDEMSVVEDIYAKILAQEN